jgi:hypothetical protein
METQENNSTDEQAETAASRRHLTLSGQLMVLVAVLALGPLLVTNYIGYQRTKDVLAEMTHQALNNAVSLAATETTDFISERKKLLSSLVAGNLHLSQASDEAARLIAEEPSRLNATLTPLERHLEAKAESTDAQARFYVLSPEGQVLGSSEGVQPRGMWRRDDLCLELAEQPSRLAIHHESDSVLYVAEPLDSSSQSTTGAAAAPILCARFDFAMASRLRELSHSQAPVERFRIINESGEVLIDTEGATDSDDSATAVLFEQLDEQDTRHGTYDSAEHGTVFAAVAPISNTDWMVTAEVPSAKAMAMLEDLKRRVFWMGSGFVAIVLLGMFLMVRTTIDPLRDLVEATKKMARGELAQTVATRGPREVAHLASVFNKMSRQVSDLHHNLEERVDQRTAELHQNQAFSQILFNSMHENLMVIDSDFRVIKANDAARRTYGDELVGKLCHVAFQASDCEDEKCPLRRALESGEPVEEERVHLNQTSPEIMHTQVFPLPAPTGQPPNQVLMVTRPITDEKQELASTAADEKVSAYALMAASVAHEIGNPLSSISAQLQLAKRKKDPEFTEKVIDIIDGQVSRIDKLLRDMTAFSSRQSNHATFVYWNQVIEDVVRLLRHGPHGRFVSFELDLADELPAAYAAPERCFQVLLNLGLNALDAMEGRGTLTIETWLDGEEIMIRTSDTGPGITDDVEEHIFEPYFSTKDPHKGSGLGLFISKRIVEQMDGVLEYEAVEGGGASFIIRVPVATRARVRA